MSPSCIDCIYIPKHYFLTLSVELRERVVSRKRGSAELAQLPPKRKLSMSPCDAV